MFKVLFVTNGIEIFDNVKPVFDLKKLKANLGFEKQK